LYGLIHIEFPYNIQWNDEENEEEFQAFYRRIPKKRATEQVSQTRFREMVGTMIGPALIVTFNTL
jgi:hypothetical protein